MRTILIFGDSITFGGGDSIGLGWCGRLQKYFEAQNPCNHLDNLGISGNFKTSLIIEEYNVFFLPTKRWQKSLF